MRRVTLVLFWSVLAAAFLGPGTVTTAASAGAGHGLRLLWALAFSTLACVVLQEASARVTLMTGEDLGRALRSRHGRGLQGVLVLLLVLGAIVVGCAAYEAGNILGAVAGASLLGGTPRVWTAAVAAMAAVLLWRGSPQQVARILGGVVAVMGVAFLATAARLSPQPADVLRGTLLPSMPEGAGFLVLGLVGTTVVPYNLFLGSGLARGQGLGEMRLGITIAVVMGGVISMGVVVVGASLDGVFGFAALAQALADRLGTWASGLFALGLFAAGLSSAVTAPLAAAFTARSLSTGADSRRWAADSWRFRSVWGGVLAVGVAFGLSGVRPVPVILLAQALNGLLLPFVACFLLLVVNDTALMGARGRNGALANVLASVVVAITIVLGVSALLRAASSLVGDVALGEDIPLRVGLAAAAAIAFPLTGAVRRRRRQRTRSM